MKIIQYKDVDTLIYEIIQVLADPYKKKIEHLTERVEALELSNRQILKRLEGFPVENFDEDDL